MNAIAVFLAAQLDVDKAAAQATTPVPVPGRWSVVRDKHADDNAPLSLIQGEDEYGPNDGDYQYGVPVIAHAADWQGEAAENLAHIARHDPARVLRDVAAKRRILRLYEVACASGGPESMIRVLEEVIQTLARAYADEAKDDGRHA